MDNFKFSCLSRGQLERLGLEKLFSTILIRNITMLWGFSLALLLECSAEIIVNTYLFSKKYFIVGITLGVGICRSKSKKKNPNHKAELDCNIKRHTTLRIYPVPRSPYFDTDLSFRVTWCSLVKSKKLITQQLKLVTFVLFKFWPTKNEKIQNTFLDGLAAAGSFVILWFDFYIKRATRIISTKRGRLTPLESFTTR